MRGRCGFNGATLTAEVGFEARTGRGIGLPFVALQGAARRCWPGPGAVLAADRPCQSAGTGVYSPAFPKFRLRVPCVMEINPILNSIKDLSERSQTIRGYL